MTAGADITIRDTGWSIVEDLEAMAGELQAGILEGVADHEDANGRTIPMATLALIHEDGAPRAKVPKRPFMRPTFDQNEDAYVNRVEHITAAAAKGAPAGVQLVALADKMAKDIRETVERGKTGGPPLEPISSSRVAQRKQGLTPLIDTGTMVAAVQGQFVDGDVDGRTDG